ncbi:hypothetical protein SAMN05660235_00068 [Sporolituus thermophilus DSM 23256]|uniref:Uncharacterized protein n=1 Tax=Sporolituus thermophilus DSM 23256 TaxID=1123285 RepID=A0A1G7HHR9_9FIRM|nr:hypothetical protein SAMN05660235_00068 [Sporolituus thermophilus DSM 23256]
MALAMPFLFVHARDETCNPSPQGKKKIFVNGRNFITYGEEIFRIFNLKSKIQNLKSKNVCLFYLQSHMP